MFIVRARQLHTLISDAINGNDHTALNAIHEAHVSARDFLVANAERMPSPEDLQDAISLIHDALDIKLSSEQLTEMLQLFPVTRIKLAAYGAGDTEVLEGLLNIVYAFFVGCYAPTFGDNLPEHKTLNGYLQDKAKSEGYEVTQCHNQ
ncbi:hypothetical protein [Vibrio phage vB_ValS_PJ32]|nr:hypothetical protein [Vibrio phage vB_ValS_PJ32]